MSNVLDLSVEWSKAKASIDAHNASLKEAINLMPQIAKTFNKPSDAVNVSKQITQTKERIKLTSEEIVNQRQLAQSADQHAKSVSNLVGEYKRIEAQVYKLTQTYNNLAIKQQLGQTLTAKEVATLELAQKELIKYNTALKNVDAGIGKHTRNVGNYEGATRNLKFSLAQITRELPNFGQSMQIGIMSLTNNIGALQDGIEQVRLENEKLRADGKQTQSIFKIIKGSLFSLNTALFIGIGVMSAYGKEIGQWVESLFDANKNLEEITKRQKEFNDARLTGRKDAQTEILEVRKYLAVVKDEKLSYDQRLIALKSLRQQYPYYFRDLKDAQIYSGDYAKAESELLTALEKRKEVEKKTELNVVNKQRLIELQKEIDLQKEAVKRAEESAKTLLTQRFVRPEAFQGVADQQKRAQEKLNKAILEYNTISKLTIQNDADIFKLKKESILLEYQEEKATKDKTKAKEDYIKKLREEYLERTKIAELQPKQLEEGFLVKLKEQKKAFEELRDTLSSTSEEYANYQKVVDGLQRSIDLIEDPSKVIKADLSSWENYIKLLKDVETRSEDAKKKTAELEEELKSLFKSIYNGQLSNLGFDSLVPMFDGTFDKMWNTADTFNEKFAVGMKFIGDVAKDTFEFINSQQQANYEAQYQRLEMQKENALLFAGESSVAQKNIEEEYDRRRKEIQRRQAQDQQKIAIFNSLINTAQGVTAALATANIPLAITIGILGAIQTAFIASQKIPQFYKGTKNAPEGIAFTDEKGAELHTDKYGNIKDFGSDKGARLKHLSAGDKIYTAEETQRLLFNKDLNNILVKNDIRYSDERTVEEIKSLKEIIKNKPTFAVQIDKRGKAVYEKKNGIRIKILDNVINIKGYDI